MEDASPSPQTSAIPQMRFGKIDDLSSRVAAAIGGAGNYLFSQQHEEGYWCGELEADTTLESDYIMLHTLLGTGDMDRFRKAARYILQHQNEDGGWPIYAGGPSNVSASVKAYFGLKLAGFTADHSALVRARKKILELGGVTGQYIHQDLSLLLWPVRLRCRPGDPARDRAVSQLVLVQHLRNIFLVARNPGAALNLLCQEAFQENTRRDGRRRVVRRGTRQVAYASALGQEAALLAQFFLVA